MKTKLIKRTLAAIAVLAFGLAFVFAAVTGKAGGVTVNAEEASSAGYNLYNVYKRYAGNSTLYAVDGKNIADTTVIKDEVVYDENEGSYLKLTNLKESADNYILRNNISFAKDTVYKISFEAKAENYKSGDVWFVYPRVILNGTVTSYDTLRAQGNVSEWKKYNYEFTATADSSTGNNLIDLIIRMATGCDVLIRNIEVNLPENHFEGKKNIAPAGGLSPRSSDTAYLSKTTVTDENFGEISELKVEKDFTGNKVYLFDQEIIWTKGATYEIIFRVKTSVGSNVGALIQGKVPGKADKVLIQSTDLINGKGQGVWQNIYCRFNFDDVFTNDNEKNTTSNLYMLITKGNANDVIYMTDIKIFGNVSSVNKVTNGKTVTENVITGSEYTIAENPVVANKTVVGWDYNGALKFADDKITVNEDVTLNAVFIDYTVEQGAYIRLAEDSGLRFVANISEETIAVLKKYGNVEFGMRFTSDSSALEGEFDVKTNKWASGGAEGGKFYAALTGFTAENNFYGVNFTAQAYAKIYDADGKLIATVLSESTCTKSVSEVANAALNAEKENPGTYTEAQLEIINALTGKQGE